MKAALLALADGLDDHGRPGDDVAGGEDARDARSAACRASALMVPSRFRSHLLSARAAGVGAHGRRRR
ncbi:MAG: hypothetical protein MZV70_60165 [Desulfobacterales bacterium]|nr:hypothetical protein [Desulfobacterales bacterium]